MNFLCLDHHSCNSSIRLQTLGGNDGNAQKMKEDSVKLPSKQFGIRITASVCALTLQKIQDFSTAKSE